MLTMLLKKVKKTSKINIVNTMVNEYDKNRYRAFGSRNFVNMIFAISGICLNFKNNDLRKMSLSIELLQSLVKNFQHTTEMKVINILVIQILYRVCNLCVNQYVLLHAQELIEIPKVLQVL